MLLVLLCSGCLSQPPRDLDELFVQDSTYYAPETMEPFQGVVYRSFPDDPDRIQLEATMKDGTWNGELTIYHETGRIHMQGELVDGVQCGGWVENEDENPPASLYEELKQDLESLVMYPECPQ